MSSRVASLAPTVDDRTVVLILGSMPGTRSLEAGQYYANERNDFWRIVCSIFGNEPAPAYEERVEFLRQRGIGLWDVMRECSRPGSSDSSIRDAVPNDLEGMVASHPGIRCLFFNGAKAKEVFDSTVSIDPVRRSKMRFELLPSTSPANARLS